MIDLKIIDQEAYSDILKPTEASDLHNYMSHTKPRRLRENLGPDDSLLLYEIIDDANVIGMLWLEEITTADAKLGLYITSAGNRGKGAGTRVISRIKEIAVTKLKLKRLYLNVRGGNARAIKCYEKCGFRIIKEYECHNFPDGSCQNSYRMDCELK